MSSADDDAAPRAALDGLLVADFSRILAGPYATMLLADLGADVVKIERPPDGDDTRSWGPPWSASGDATYFLGVNRNKRSVALDLTQPSGRRAAQALAFRADVVVQNFKPGGLERLGLGYDAVREVNPGVVYASITGFGRGLGGDLPGYDLLAQAVGGLMSITGPGPDQPTKVGVAMVDVVTGLHAALGILAALHHRERTGRGQHVEVNLLSSLLSALVNQASGYVEAGVVPAILGNRHPSIAPYEVLPARDRALALAVGNDGQFRALCLAIGRPDLNDDARFHTNPARVAHRELLVSELSETLSQADAEEWFVRLQAVGVPCGPVNSLEEAFALADSLGLSPVVDISGTRSVAHPVTLSETPARYVRRPPDVGEDTEWLYRFLADRDQAGSDAS